MVFFSPVLEEGLFQAKRRKTTRDWKSQDWGPFSFLRIGGLERGVVQRGWFLIWFQEPVTRSNPNPVPNPRQTAAVN